MDLIMIIPGEGAGNQDIELFHQLLIKKITPIVKNSLSVDFDIDLVSDGDFISRSLKCEHFFPKPKEGDEALKIKCIKCHAEFTMINVIEQEASELSGFGSEYRYE